MSRVVVLAFVLVASSWFAHQAQAQTVSSSTYPVVGFVPDINASFTCEAAAASCDLRCYNGIDNWAQVTSWSLLEMKSIGAGFVLMTGFKDAAKTEQVAGGPLLIRDVLHCEITKPARLN